MATAMSPMVLCSQNLSDGSSSSPRPRSMHSSWPTWRTTLPPCSLCLCFPKSPYPSIALLLWMYIPHNASNNIPMTWTRSQPATAHRAPISPLSPSGCTSVQVLWNGNLICSPTAEKPVHCPRSHTRLCMHGNLRECNHMHQTPNKKKPFKGQSKGQCADQGEEDLETP